MTQLIVQEKANQASVEDKAKPTKILQANIQNTINTLRSLKDDAGQIVELKAEEKNLVAEFFAQFLKLTLPLTQSISISAEVLKNEKGEVAQANIDPTGHLIIIYPDKSAELADLGMAQNRDLMLSVVEDALPKFTDLIKSRKQRIERRIDFLSAVTKEMQEISEALDTDSE